MKDENRAYLLIRSDGFVGLSKGVNAFLDKGYVPFGNVFSHIDANGLCKICQPMIRKHQDEQKIL
jgi:hypothetical protein